MGQLLEFARGPLFRLTFALMVLGLLRLVGLSLWNVVVAYCRAADKTQPYKLIMWRTARWLLPWNLLRNRRPVYAATAMVFHIGLILVPILLFGHIELWRKSTGLHWPALPQGVADAMTLVTVAAAGVLFVLRLVTIESRTISVTQDVLWPPLLAAVFVTGFLTAHPSLCPLNYRAVLLLHVLSAELVFVLIPFTKLAHCVLIPFSHMLADLAWRFPATSGDDVAATLGKQGKPL